MSNVVFPVMRASGCHASNSGLLALMTAIVLGAGSAGTGIAFAGPAAKTHTVIIDAMKFTPATIEVNAGDTIIWNNKDPFPHTVTAQDRSFNSGEIASNRSWKFKPLKNGRFVYVCALHTGMQGVLIVK